MKTLRLILGDQLNLRHSWFAEQSDAVTYCLMELRSETSYVVHHIQKILGFFGAMRACAASLTTRGHQVVYLRFDDPLNEHTFTANVIRLVRDCGFTSVEYQLPDEFRLDQELSALAGTLRAMGITVMAVDSEHFLSDRNGVRQHFQGKKQRIMESFYRAMRVRYDILMDGGKPEGGAWNYDQENRRKLPAGLPVPPPKRFQHDVSALAAMIASQQIATMGTVDATRFDWPLTRDESLESLEYFVTALLPQFGIYQDAMSTEHDLLFHSRLSFSLNTKMLAPLEVIQRAIAEYRARPAEISLAQVEGFVRQILGWREYVRGIYWAEMPRYRTLNVLNHQRPLPGYFWTGKTSMRCMHHSVRQSLSQGYAHHIQRLMVIGNFSLLAGLHPDAVDAWYLGVYCDAIEWVEITNTRGMSQYADGGIVGTKPYVSSANYIDKMSDYCTGCFYDKKKRTGDRACPFNSLYWDFHLRHERLLRANARLPFVYKNLDRMSDTEKAAIREQAAHYLEGIEEL